jgi:hypothetical protein
VAGGLVGELLAVPGVVHTFDQAAGPLFDLASLQG